MRAKEEQEAAKLIDDALALQEAGCFAIVLEKIPAKLAKTVTEKLVIPTVGIGAGPDCDGQVLVVNDMLGMNADFKPKFMRHFANLHEQITTAVAHYVAEVKAVQYPNEDEQY
ncbi:3-methyl-2-oxobutanoate hydroxymethyltransferase [Sphingobacterium multivorum]|uniref:3-methyl-2-oxobutanoate hydroxymethyltransferase n=1 Tax=Sphingobacterium multivorum TaxID=28454 RepID=A0A2X2K3V8_SPHMU|nr:3-methyl-2-oxobutanoate hydroxymethyltransferase [Sphingobacterium multivorum]